MSDASPRRHVVVVIGATDGDTRDEAFRAALGLSLRGARVFVAVTDANAALGPAAQRARSVLDMLGHVVQLGAAAGDGVATELALADVVEVWGGPAAPPPPVPTGAGTTSHVLRPDRVAARPAPGDRVLHLPPVLDRDDADRLLDQLLATDRVVVW